MSGEIRKKYVGLQSELKRHFKAFKTMGDYSCLFLSVCSIAEEYNEAAGNGRRLDIAAFAVECFNAGLLKEDWTCGDQERMLNLATGANWKKAEVKSLPAVVPENVYTVEKWHNPRTGYDHFRRRWGDTLESSVTVKEGSLVCYYTYTHGEN